MQKLTGFVIKKIDYGAEDEIISIFSRHEVITLIALGTRKMKSKNRVALQIGNFVEIEYFRARLANKISKLKKASIVIQPPLNNGNTAEIILELYRYLSNIQSESALLFKALIDVYAYLGGEYNQNIKTYVLFSYLDVIGHYPQNNMCVECGRNDRINGFEFYKGGFLCALHNKKPRTLQELKAIQNLFATFDDYASTDAKINQRLQAEVKKYIDDNMYV